ncbi:MAG: glycerol-3-phosphate 1-O-acyltransferase PlsY [Paracoccaceae bacterium]|jgi:acyl phosphate:glycerol-3-phosphate acyltransferase|nr:MAG: glycerol-3-phosphate acyltransferase [Rhodobacter sp. BACL10 MAG-120910-bin24]KRP24778.1 MAG: glycerol-3-phosphate acyltransferase [Rhodobacter sp. BACL10 MAG-120419-bin15]MDA0354928.1 glycerol-3-phosphate 1-O-acyltransferase PlsY [Pseudomonadota bacterium]MDP5322375.1 glycerol-3-phosphate 1-O-acyltransferase PlsY [Paracoccaceae bacterium]HCB53217.1 acyl-phosphate glycerol 3-phosphate acyltransferase [Rhodobacter sp.]
MPEITSSLSLLALIALGAYLLGAVPFGIVITRGLGLGDLRQIGSGNIGATNVLRTGNRWAALMTLLLDAGKGGIAVVIARQFGPSDAEQLAALAAFLGHLFPIWLGFRGGKGVATFLGTLTLLAWPVGLASCATWLVTFALTRISSLSALIAALSVVFWLGISGYSDMIALGASLAALILWRHEANIKRLLAGTEPRFTKRQ